MDAISLSIEPLQAFLVDLVHFLPRLLLAIAVLFAGWLIGRVLRVGAVKALRAVNFHVITEQAGVDRALKHSGADRDTTDILGIVVHWTVLLVALILACNTLGLVQVGNLIERVLLLVPSLIVAVLVIALGAYFARFVAAALEAYCRSAGLADASLLGRLVFYAIVVFVVLAALDQLSITGELVRLSFLIVLSGVVFGLALAFGFGGRRWAADLLERWRSASHSEDATATGRSARSRKKAGAQASAS